MKKIIWLLSLVMLAMASLSYASENIDMNPIIKKVSIVWKMKTLFSALGMDINRDFNLLMEVHGLVDYRKTSLGRNKLYRILKPYNPNSQLMSQLWNRLPHVDCKVGKYTSLNHDFYTQIASVIPAYNNIKTYRLSAFPAVLYTVGSGDIDQLSDNCKWSTLGKDDKAAGCVLRMRHHFSTSDFEIVSCK